MVPVSTMKFHFSLDFLQCGHPVEDLFFQDSLPRVGAFSSNLFPRKCFWRLSSDLQCCHMAKVLMSSNESKFKLKFKATLMKALKVG